MKGIEVYEIGRVRFKGRAVIVGLSPLRKSGKRGIAFTPKRDNVAAVVASTHLPPYGKMIQEAFIHETLHIAMPRASEKEVEQAAHLVAKVLRVVERARKPKRLPQQ